MQFFFIPAKACSVILKHRDSKLLLMPSTLSIEAKLKQREEIYFLLVCHTKALSDLGSNDPESYSSTYLGVSDLTWPVFV